MKNLNVLIQVLLDGRITDSQGRTVDFKNTVIILTSNLGSSIILDGIESGGEISAQAKEEVNNLLKVSFRPEFLNRLDEIVFYKPLNKLQIIKIVDLMLNALKERLKDKKLNLEITSDAKNYIVENGYDAVYGARPLKRFIQSNLETLLAKFILKNELKANDILIVDKTNDELSISVK